jgi:hypothetical protein
LQIPFCYNWNIVENGVKDHNTPPYFHYIRWRKKYRHKSYVNKIWICRNTCIHVYNYMCKLKKIYIQQNTCNIFVENIYATTSRERRCTAGFFRATACPIFIWVDTDSI